MPVKDVRLQSGAVIEFEVGPPPDAEAGGYGEVAAAPQRTMQQIDAALEPLRELVDTVLSTFRAGVEAATEIEVTLGVKFGLEGQIIVAKGSAESNLEIVLRYKKEPFVVKDE